MCVPELLRTKGELILREDAPLAATAAEQQFFQSLNSVCRFGSRKPEINNSSPPAGFSEAEAKPNRGIDRTPIEEAVRQAAIVLREHYSGIGIKLLRKLPIDGE